MEFEDYAAARDLLYLAALFAGSGIGCVLNRFRLESTLRFRNRTVTLALCLFSGMVAALAGALIYSRGLIVFEKSLYIPVLLTAALLVPAVRFPRALGFPLILVSGCVVIWMGYSFLQFPRFDRGAFRVSVSGEGNGQYAVRFASGRRANQEQNLVIRLAGEGEGGENFLEFSFIRLGYAAPFPLIGGENRGIITEIRGKDTVFYADKRFAGNLLRGWYAGFRKTLPGESKNRPVLFEESRENVFVTDILPGMTRELGFGGS
jgi:hypothetical protein